ATHGKQVFTLPTTPEGSNLPSRTIPITTNTPYGGTRFTFRSLRYPVHFRFGAFDNPAWEVHHLFITDDHMVLNHDFCTESIPI
ncbi:hypothetical protein, partial [Anditalea andensis]|uniref:hypothetical protein n=1 Tax=Anditalea andensis TaxID=1048983 RepID=UPI001969A8EF